MPNPTIKIFDINGDLIEERQLTDEETAEREAQIAALWAADNANA
jgi:hypothetical protein